MPDLPINPDQRPPYRRRAVLRAGDEAGWWTYESENPAGSTIGGVTYDEVTHTLKMPDDSRVTLPASEVEGWAHREARLHEGGLERIAYRPGLLP